MDSLFALIALSMMIISAVNVVMLSLYSSIKETPCAKHCLLIFYIIFLASLYALSRLV